MKGLEGLMRRFALSSWGTMLSEEILPGQKRGVAKPYIPCYKTKKWIEVFRNQQLYQKSQRGKPLEVTLINKAGFEKKEARRE